MFSNHVTSLSSPYFHGELTAEEDHRVAEHLLVCPACRAEYEEVKAGVRIADQIKVMPAPDSLWAGVVGSLDGARVSRGPHWFTWPLAVAAAIVIIVGASLLLLRQSRSDASSPWNVAR